MAVSKDQMCPHTAKLAAIETIQKNMPKAEKAVARRKWDLKKAFQKCFEQWLHDWNKYADPKVAAGRKSPH